MNPVGIFIFILFSGFWIVVSAAGDPFFPPKYLRRFGPAHDGVELAEQNAIVEVHESLLWFLSEMVEHTAEHNFNASRFEKNARILADALETIESVGRQYIRNDNNLLMTLHSIEEVFKTLSMSVQMLLFYNSASERSHVLLRLMINVNIRLSSIQLEMHSPDWPSSEVADNLRWCWFDMARCAYEFKSLEHPPIGVKQCFEIQRLKAQEKHKHLKSMLELG